MRSYRSTLIALAAVLGVLAAGMPALAVVVGPDVTNRAHYDNGTHITYLDCGRATPISGYVSQWTLWAGRAVQVKLQVFKPEADGFRLMGQNVVSITAPGLQTFSIAEPDQIAVLPGYVLGFRTVDSYGAVRYDDGGSHKTTWPESRSTDIAIGGLISNSWLSYPRTYSLAATITPGVVPEPSTMAVLAIGLMGLARRRRVR